MVPRSLRIAVSVFFALVAVAFAVLWVRSLTWADQYAVRVSSTYHLRVGSQLGSVWFDLDNSPRAISVTKSIDDLYGEAPKPQLWGSVYFRQGTYGAGAPHWFLILASGIM